MRVCEHFWSEILDALLEVDHWCVGGDFTMLKDPTNCIGGNYIIEHGLELAA